MRAVLASCLLVGCAPTDIVVATLPAHRDGGQEQRTCLANEDCHDDDFCSRNSCDDVTGRCERRPKLPDSTASPVCGCDGISYWNDSIRMAQGITATTPDTRECLVDALACTGPGTCPHHASCVRTFSSDTACSSDATGTCWQLPDKCPPAGEERFARCGDATSCDPACEAFKSEQLYARIPSATCP